MVINSLVFISLFLFAIVTLTFKISKEIPIWSLYEESSYDCLFVIMDACTGQ